MLYRYLALLLLYFSSTLASAQETKDFKATYKGVAGKDFPSPELLPNQIVKIEAVHPDGEGVRSHLLQLKAEQKRLHPKKSSKPAFKAQISDSVWVDQKRLHERLVGNFGVPLVGGIPNDNSLAISNQGIVLHAYNSFIGAYNAHTGEDLYPSTGRYALGLIAIDFSINNANFFDPKVAYDPIRDRFVLAFLRGNLPDNSAIILAFSLTNDPRDGWHVYSLPGNPLNNNRWTDFPVIALSESELFFTANFIVPDEPWQTGFDGSMIWQVNLDKAFEGHDSLDARLWHNIRYNNRYIRNLHAVQHADKPTGQGIYLLSNRNFALENDSIFLLHLNDSANSPQASLKVQPLISPLPYGVPPNARQSDTDTNDPATGFDTNDGRVLGAILIGDRIQFVSNTIDTSTGRCGIYHGIVSNIQSEIPEMSAKIIGHERLDFGYPNIAWTGVDDCQNQVMMVFNHSSPTDAAGYCALYMNNLGEYSPITFVVKGESYVDRIQGKYERWGDYIGLQRRYNKPSEVWAAGYYGLSSQSNATFTARLLSKDSLILEAQVLAEEGNVFCNANIQIETQGGLPPYTYYFNNQNSSNSLSAGYCAGDTVMVAVEDALGCRRNQKVVIPFKSLPNNNLIYPNPSKNLYAIRFQLPVNGNAELVLSNLQGQIIYQNSYLGLSSGLHELLVDASFLSAGTYVLRLTQGDEILVVEKIMKN